MGLIIVDCAIVLIGKCHCILFPKVICISVVDRHCFLCDIERREVECYVVLLIKYVLANWSMTTNRDFRSSIVLVSPVIISLRSMVSQYVYSKDRPIK